MIRKALAADRARVLLTFLAAFSTATVVSGQTSEDRDGDGFYAVVGCGTPRDCNDDDLAIHPGANESCDGRDGDCNGLVDDALECDRTCDNPETLPGSVQVSVNPSLVSNMGNVVWTGNGWIVAHETWWQDSCTCTELFLQKLGQDGAPIGGPVSIAGGDGVFLTPRNPWLAWTGSEILVAWSEAVTSATCFNVIGQFRVVFRRFRDDLTALGSKVPLQCSDTGGPNTVRPVWSGAQYGMVWDYSDGLHFTTFTRDGVPENPCGMVVSGTNNPGFPSLAWNGTWFGLSWTEGPPDADWSTIFDEIYYRRIGEDSTLPDPDPIRLTFDPERSQWNSVVWADGEWAISWSDDRAAPVPNFSEVFLMRLDGTGAKIDPPGDVRVTCCNSNAGGDTRWFNKLEWTGEEFGVLYQEQTHPFFTSGDVLLQRVNSAGSTVGAPVVVTPDSALLASHVDSDWNGREYGVVWDDVLPGVSARQVVFGRVGCNCTDTDGDTFSTCAGGDCDDDDPLVNPSVGESCLNGADDDCDRVTDCQDASSCPPDPGSVPGEVAGLTFAADKETMDWGPEPISDVYDLLTGDMGELRADAGFGRSRCLAWRVAQTMYADASTPLPGAGSYYLVRGKADRCRLGTWGSALRDGAT